MRETEREIQGKMGNKISLVSHELLHSLLDVLPLLSLTTYCVPALRVFICMRVFQWECVMSNERIMDMGMSDTCKHTATDTHLLARQ